MSPQSCITAFLLAACCPLSAQLTVTTVTPARNGIGVPNAAPIALTFNQPVDRTTITPRSFAVFGRWTGVVTGAFTFSNGDRTVTLMPGKPFFPGDLVLVSLSSAVAATGGGGNLAGGHAWTFWAAAAPGSGTVAQAGTINCRRNGEGSVRAYGAYAGDLDRDGAPDLSIPCEVSDDVRVWRADGCGAFAATTPMPVPAGSTPSPNEGADFNGDGWIDMAIGNTTGNSVSVFLNNGAGAFLPPVTYPSGNGTRGVAVFDVDADGDPDIVTANRDTSNLALHRNNGNRTFAPATFFEGGGTGETSVVAADANGDGKLDLFVGCYGSRTVTILLGNGTGTFTLSASQNCGGQPWMIAVGDLDGDGDADVATANFNSTLAGIVRGTGTGGLVSPAITITAGQWPIAVDLGDLDGDGDLDLAISNYLGASFMVWRNDGTGNFGSRVTLTAPQSGSCMLFVDYDRDGDNDLIGIDENADILFFYRQTGPSPAGVQPPSCDATLRIDELANRGGYGGAPAHDARLGGRVFVGITSAPALLHVVLLSAGLEPGLATPFGILNLDPLVFTPLLVGATDAAGEASSLLPIDAGLPPGVEIALQAVVPDATFAQARFTNPEKIVLRN